MGILLYLRLVAIGSWRVKGSQVRFCAEFLRVSAQVAEKWLPGLRSTSRYDNPMIIWKDEIAIRVF
ncbi:MAG: hypothetical protein RLZZ113_1634 [Pseudomonadota bacterium]